MVSIILNKTFLPKMWTFGKYVSSKHFQVGIHCSQLLSFGDESSNELRSVFTYTVLSIVGSYCSHCNKKERQRERERKNEGREGKEE